MASDALRQKVADLPRAPGVYLWKDAGEAAPPDPATRRLAPPAVRGAGVHSDAPLAGPGGATVLYVGKAIDLRARVSQYLDAVHPRTAALMEQAADVDFIVVRNEKEALLLEQTLIKRYRPRYNVRLTDDKQYPYIVLTREPYPRLVKTHRHMGRDAVHFGPFPDGYGAFRVLQALSDLLPLRRCRVLPKEKCLYLDIGKCLGPCVGACTDEEYDAVVEEAREVLSGRSSRLLQRLRLRLESAAEAGRFEEAARLRDQLVGLEGVLERQHMVAERLEERDIAALAAQGDDAVVVLLHQREGKIMDQSAFVLHGASGREPGHALMDFLLGLYADRSVPRHLVVDMDADAATELERELRLIAGHAVTVEAPQKGDKRRWLEVALTNARLRLEQELAGRRRRGEGAIGALQKTLGLGVLPRIIEGFDVSHQAGEFTRAALVRFVDGEPQKSGYRTFNMKTVGATAVAAGTAKTKGKGRDVDDFASIHEAVQRRYRGVQERGEELPDLVLIDGGPGQLAAARAALVENGLAAMPVCSLAKEEETLHLAGTLRPIKLKRDDPALQLLQRVRDESHRFGIAQVRRKAVGAITSSPLDDVPGIGPRRRAELVKAFAGLEGLRAASVEDLQRVPGVTAATAARIVAVLQQSAAVDGDGGDRQSSERDPDDREADASDRHAKPNARAGTV